MRFEFPVILPDLLVVDDENGGPVLLCEVLEQPLPGLADRGTPFSCPFVRSPSSGPPFFLPLYE